MRKKRYLVNGHSESKELFFKMLRRISIQALEALNAGIEVTTKCKVNMKTHEIFDIETAEIDGIEILDEEYISIDNVSYPVHRASDLEENDTSCFWYE